MTLELEQGNQYVEADQQIMRVVNLHLTQIILIFKMFGKQIQIQLLLGQLAV